jgi:hypothetical protein
MFDEEWILFLSSSTYTLSDEIFHLFILVRKRSALININDDHLLQIGCLADLHSIGGVVVLELVVLKWKWVNIWKFVFHTFEGCKRAYIFPISRYSYFDLINLRIFLGFNIVKPSSCEIKMICIKKYSLKAFTSNLWWKLPPN